MLIPPKCFTTMMLIMANTTKPATATASGQYLANPLRSSSRLMSSIMTTNRNSTITAPTYTSTSTIPRNSASSSTQMTALLKKHSTKSSAEYTGLRDRITPKAAPTSTVAKIKNRIVGNISDTAHRRHDPPQSWLHSARQCQATYPCS